MWNLSWGLQLLWCLWSQNATFRICQQTKQQNNKQNVLCRYTCNVHYQIGPGPQTTPEGRTACWLTAVFFIVAANRLTWTLSVVSPSVERQFSISYMRRQAAVQLFINASILVLKTSVSQGRQRLVLKWCRFVMIISRSASGGEFVQRQLWYHWLQKYSNTSHRSEIQLCSLTLECSLISNKMFVRHASCFT